MILLSYFVSIRNYKYVYFELEEICLPFLLKFLGYISKCASQTRKESGNRFIP